jgi:hypothetical protein
MAEPRAAAAAEGYRAEVGMSFGIFLFRPPGSGRVDRKAFRAVLQRWGWDGSADFPYHVGTSTGITVEVYASALEDHGRFAGCSLEVRGFDTELCRLVLDLARAGRFEISSDADSEATILTDESQRANVWAGCPRVMVCSTPEELEAALTGGFEVWQAYRDRVCGPSGERAPAERGAAPARGGTKASRRSRPPPRRGK